ncbi:MAG: sel1 repeat family protein [Gammaproteobacteria bacterium]|nr:sel1 repeat family protein [Gammaproteobacteria bacterium]
MYISRKISWLVYLVGFALCASQTGFAGDLEDAHAAYDANDFLEAATLVRPLAREGVADAEYLYGRMFERGEGVVKDLQQAKSLYESAARHGHAKAKQRLIELAKNLPSNSPGAGRVSPSPTNTAAVRSRIESTPARLSAEPEHAVAAPVVAPRAELAPTPMPSRTVRNEESVALDWYLDSAKRGDPEAQYNLGVVYEIGMGVAVNEMEAARWFREAVTAKHDGAQLHLGLMLLTRGDTGAVGEGNKLLRAAAGGGNRVAERFVQDILDPQRPNAETQANMARRLREALAHSEGSALALLRDKEALASGAGTARNNVDAIERSVARAPEARNDVPARRFDEPSGLSNESRTLRERQAKAPFLSDRDDQVPRLVDGPNGSQVVFPSSMAVEPSPAPAPAAPPSNFANGGGAPTSVDALLAAANQGQGDAQFQLGMLLLAGKGVRRDENVAWQWMRKAASQQHVGARAFLRLIESANDPSVTQSRAVSWLVEGARQGDSEAMFQLAEVYEAGRGVTQDAALAADWLRVAAAAGHPSAVRKVADKGQGGLESPTSAAFGMQPRNTQAASGDWVWILLTAAAAIAVLVMLFRSPAANLELGKLALPQMGGMGRRLFGGGLAPTQMQVTEMQLLQDIWVQDTRATQSVAPSRAPRAEAPLPTARPTAPAPAHPAGGGVDINAGMVDLTAAPAPAPAPMPAAAPAPAVMIANAMVDITAMPTSTMPATTPDGFEICPETGALVMKAPILNLDGTTPPPVPAPAKPASPAPVAAAAKQAQRPNYADLRLPVDSLLAAADPDDISARNVARGQRTRERVSFDQFSEFPIGMVQDMVSGTPASPPPPVDTHADVATPAPPVTNNLITLPAETGEDGAVPFNVGMMFYRGQGAPKNDKLAFRWMLKAAELGHVEAQYRVGEMYTHGNGVEKNRLLALKWIRKAAAAGFALAAQALEEHKPRALT